MPESVWVRAEISELSGKNGNLYLQLTERSERGDPLGRAKGVIWKSRAGGITSKFIDATGEGLKTDIKILCLVQVRFDGLYGLDLVIEDVDPSYTLGDLAAKLARIRQHLIDERIFARNSRGPSNPSSTVHNHSSVNRWRRRLRQRSDKKKYGQRWQVETANSMIKRLLGPALRARGY